MAITEQRASLSPVEPTSIQPGGGLCMSLEQAWSRLRRAYLRTVRPGYVRRMRERRQGACKDCPHDIIDPRDLKLCRNVCGYWFREEDDRFRWRNHLLLARAGLAEIVCFTLLLWAAAAASGLAVAYLHPIFLAPLFVSIVLWLFVISFFRDPVRQIPVDQNAVLSPADGTVTHIEEIDDVDFPGGRAFRISIFLSVFNVHVNRMPRSGRVKLVRYFPGAFLDARRLDSALRNEQLWIDMEDSACTRLIRVKQISGAIARRIVCWLKPGDEVKAGERFGMIKFGSRTDLLLPAGEPMDIKVRLGDKVKGGSTVLLAFSTASVAVTKVPPAPAG